MCFRAVDTAGNPNAASTSTDDTVTYDNTDPTFDSIDADGGSPTVTATFSEPIDCTTVQTDDFLASVDGNPVTVSSVTCSGASDATIGVTLATAPTGGQNVTIALQATATPVADPAGNPAASTSRSTTATAVTVTVNQKSGTEDPTAASPVEFTAVFSEPVTGLTASDIVVSGTAAGTKTVTVTPATGPANTYEIDVAGMTSDGTVIVTIPAGAALDDDGDGNLASTSTDNSITYDTTGPTFIGIEATAFSVDVTVTFSENVDCATVTAGPTEDFTVTVNNVPVTTVTEECTDNTNGDASFNITLATPVPAGQEVTVQIDDLAGNGNNAGSHSDTPSLTTT